MAFEENEREKKSVYPKIEKKSFHTSKEYQKSKKIQELPHYKYFARSDSIVSLDVRTEKSLLCVQRGTQGGEPAHHY